MYQGGNTMNKKEIVDWVEIMLDEIEQTLSRTRRELELIKIEMVKKK